LVNIKVIVVLALVWEIDEAKSLPSVERVV